MDNEALKNEFLVESFENLSSVNEDLTHLEKTPEDRELLNKIYRTVHTMKGSASFLGYKKLQNITHSAENVLDELRESNLKLLPEIVDALLQSFDLCSKILRNIEKENNEGEFDILSLKDKLDYFLSEDFKQEPSSSSEVKNEESQKVEDGLVQEMENVIKSNPAIDVEATQEEDLDQLIAGHREKEDSSKVTKDQEGEDSSNGVSMAALESLKELVADGKMDSSLVAQLEGEQTKPAESVSVSAPTQEKESPQVEVVKKEKPKEEVIKKETSVSVEKNQVKPVEKTETKKSNENNNDESAAAPHARSIADSVVRVNVKVLDKIMNTVGELVLNRNQIVQYANSFNDHEFSKLAQHLNTITSELQSEVMSTRMQPIGSILTKFERLVRDFSRTTGKKINLRLSGQETELDKTLIEAIKDPLVHIIRNACDHGLEGVEEREEAGKLAEGTIWIKAYNESGQVTIEIVDDGRGINRDKIGAKAIEKGLISKDQLESLSDQQIFSLIFAPGFSTAEKITNISGRGVGMDVVKTNIEKIGGSVTLTSELGSGSTFKLRIPLTLAIVPALIIKSLGESFAIPQLNLVELVRLENEEDHKLIEEIQGSEFLKLRGVLTPVFRLNNNLELEGVSQKTQKINNVFYRVDLKKEGESLVNNTSQFATEDDTATNIAILNAEDQYFGIIVDEILDTEEIVVKPLSNSLKHLSLFGGATIMGDGKVALILDALGFLNCFTESRTSSKDDVITSLIKDDIQNEDGEFQENLLFKLGDERTYAVPLQLVSRLEEFNLSDVEKTGNQPIIRYLNAPMPLINVEKTLKLSGESSLVNNSGVINCIVTTIRGKHFGIIVKEILDISIDRIVIDDSTVDRDGLLGTVFIDNKTISLIDLYHIVESQNLGVKKIVTKNEERSNKQKRILLVDDSAMYRKMEGDALVSQGYQVDLAVHGEQGFEMLQKNDYDLLVTDIEMPVLDGFDFAVKIREQSNNSEIPIIALSTRASIADKEKGIKSGFNYHLEKFKKDEVLDLVAKVLKGA